MAGITHLVVPGLLGPMPRLADIGSSRFPLLERLLARADRQGAASGYGETLFGLFGLAPPEDADLPSAALAYLGDTGAAPVGVVFHAAPVHLRPDQDRLLLFDHPGEDLTEAETAVFVDAVNRHFAADGWRLEATSAGRWYLHLPQQPRLRTHPLAEVVGRNVDLFQPSGEDAAYWQGCLNEIQMLFFDLPVNARREAAGRLPVSGLWLHGGGELAAAASHPFASLEGADLLLAGLAASAGDASGDERLVVSRDAWRAVQDADPSAWQQALAGLELRLPQLMSQGELRLYPCHGQCHIYRPAHRYRVWRRPRSLREMMRRDTAQTR